MGSSRISGDVTVDLMKWASALILVVDAKAPESVGSLPVL